MMAVDRRIYLDYNATAPLLPEAREALLASLDLVGNPSSVHAEGRRARAAVELARQNVARLTSATAENVVFTASATEAAATCLTPVWYRDGDEIAVEALAVLDTDHPSTRSGGCFAPERVTRLGVDANGTLDLDGLTQWLDRSGGATAMLAIAIANGETGVVQPVEAIRERLRNRDVLFVVDAVQAAGRFPLDVAALGADALLLSGHKIGAAKGAGAMILGSEGLRPSRLVPGGGQEKGLRSGTEAIPAIASFGAAASAAARRAEDGTERLAVLRERLVNGLRSQGAEFTVLGAGVERLGNTLALAFAGRKAESVQIALDLQGFAVSSGSACSSGKVGASDALTAMGRAGAAVDPSNGLLRVSLGFETTAEEVEALSSALGRILCGGRRFDGGPIAA